MSLINEYRATEEAIKELQQRLQSLSSDEKLQKEMEFEKKLRELMGEYNKSLKSIIQILDPASYRPTGTQVKAKRERAIKIYKNPHTGEVIETKGGNHKGLKAWKAAHGAEVVEGWLQK